MLTIFSGMTANLEYTITFISWEYTRFINCKQYISGLICISIVYKLSLLLKATVFLHHQTTCHPLFVRVDSSKEILQNERSKRTVQCSRRFKECCFLPLFSFECITDYKKFLKFQYDVATIGQKNVEK